MSDAAIQQKLAAMFAANKDEVSIPKIYIDMTGDWKAAAVLDELLFWTLPKKGRTSLRVFRNKELWLAVRRSDWWDRKRLTERQSDGAITKLVELDLIEKDIFLFDGKPTVHIRMKMNNFVKMYGEKIQEIASSEEDENLIRDIADLYEMMGFPNETVRLPNETVKSNLQNGEMLNLQNGEIINSPIQPENTSIAGLKTDETKGKYQLQGIEAAMFGDRPVTEQDLPVWEIREKDAISAFESALGIPANWNWYPAKSTEEPTWRDFRKFLVEKYEADPQAFTRYNTWRNQPYVRGAMSNTDIKRFPGNFPTSWSDFEGTAKPSEPKSQPVTTDKHGIVESW